MTQVKRYSDMLDMFDGVDWRLFVHARNQARIDDLNFKPLNDGFKSNPMHLLDEVEDTARKILYDDRWTKVVDEESSESEQEESDYDGSRACNDEEPEEEKDETEQEESKEPASESQEAE